jgi:hypothetical protein
MKIICHNEKCPDGYYDANSFQNCFNEDLKNDDVRGCPFYMSIPSGQMDDIGPGVITVAVGHNNGGPTDYYDFKATWVCCQDIIEDREMNFSQGNILKSAFCFNVERHDGTNYRRELNKIIFFAHRELKMLSLAGCGEKL